MKKNLLYTLLFIGLGSLLFTSCKKDKDPLTQEEEQVVLNKYVNTWIKDNMEAYYLWNNKIPSKLDDKLMPDQFFESMLYKYDKNLTPDGDRFSWIQENYLELLESLSGVVSNELGFEYFLYPYNKNDYFGEFLYFKKGTDAATKGLKRGQVFTHVNNTKLTSDNFRAVLSDATQNSSVTLKVFDPFIDFEAGFIYFNNEQNVTINLLSRYAENPVFLDSIYTINGKTIGYLVYNFFANDAYDGTGSYDLALNTVFEKFKNKGVDNLVLDLRYNNGGSVMSAIYLSSMIVKNLNTRNVFCETEYNAEYQKFLFNRYGKDYFLDYFVNKIDVYDKNDKLTGQYPLHNVGNLQTLYILTGYWTASASELLINGLKPYMDVFLIGDVTIGKNVGSKSIYKENDSKNKWGIQPIIFKCYNSERKSDFTAGFTPNVFDEDGFMNMPKKQLGDINEALLNTAIRLITGEELPQSVRTRSVQPVRPLGSSLDNRAWSNQIIMHRNGKQLP